MSFINTVYAHGGDTSETLGNHSDEIIGMNGMMSDFDWAGMTTGGFVMILFWVLVIVGTLALIRYTIGEKRNGNRKIYTCVECGFEYEKKRWAEKCQKWCKEKKSCNLDIIKHGRPSKN